jgi:hypothetical protein
MSFTTATRDAIMDGSSIASLCTHASLHTSDPGATGVAEVAGGSYVRVPLSWQPAAGGNKLLTASVTLQVPGGLTLTHFGLWSALSSGTFRGGELLDVPVPFPTAGTYDLSITVASA